MLKKFFSYYKPHKRLFIIDFTSAVFVAILELAFPVAVQWFIDDLIANWRLEYDCNSKYFAIIHLYSKYISTIISSVI